MKNFPWGRPFLFVAVLWTLSGCDSAVNDAQAKDAEMDNKIDLSTPIMRGSYLLGYDQVAQLTAQTGGVVDVAALAAGVADAAAGLDSKVPQEELQASINAIRAAVQEKQQAAAQEADAEAAAYREAFAAKEGVTTLPSGLMYEVMTEGSGAKPGPTDTVTTHYHGTLTDGRVFDSSVDRGQPASFGVNRVIAGWTEALQLMSVGSKWRLVIPPDLAYGPRGAGELIGPNATLVFEVELLSIDTPAE